MGDCRDEQPSKQVLVDLESGSFPGDETSIKQVFIKCIVVEQVLRERRRWKSLKTTDFIF